ncbi:Transcription factor [Arachis hypogaea]|nr:Transcription factor [Arachis hypogaea]
MVCQAASQTRFRALKHENGIEGESTIVVRVIACFQPLHDCQAEYFRHLLKPVTEIKLLKQLPYQSTIASTGYFCRWMVKDHMPWPCSQHMAGSSPCLNVPEPNLYGSSAYLNPSTFILPAVSVFPGFAAPAAPYLKAEPTNEVVQGFHQYLQSLPTLKEMHTEEAMQLQNANSVSLQKKLLIFDQSGNKTRLFYSSVLPQFQSQVVNATPYVYKDEKAANLGQKHLPNSSTEESDNDHIVNEESEMHEDTEEINALLYSDDSDFSGDDDDEVTSTGHSPLVTKRTYVMQEQYEDSKEEVASSGLPNKRRKSINGEYYRSPMPAGTAGLARLNDTYEHASDAESKYSSGRVYSGGAEQTKDNSSMVDDIQLKRDKIRESLRVLENLVPGAKGKNPLLVIDETIEYLNSLMTGTSGEDNITKGSSPP